jgi:hypothetical protein
MSETQSSINWLLNCAAESAQHRNIREHGKDGLENLVLTSVGYTVCCCPNIHSHSVEDTGLRTAMSEPRTLLKRFLDGLYMEIIFNAPTRKTRSHASYMRTVLVQVGCVLEPEYTLRGKQIRE